VCTLIVLHRCIPGRPLVIAANRDEFFDRPAEDVALRVSKKGPILAPLDLEAGGTWVGLNQRGVFAGLTNLRPNEPSLDRSSRLEPARTGEEPAQQEMSVTGAAEKELKSRGDVVMAALESESAVDAMRKLSQLEEAAYNPFQLLVADGQDAWLIVYRDRPRAIELEPGPHIVGNVEDEQIAARLGIAEGLSDRGRKQGAGSEMREVPTLEKSEKGEGVEGLFDSEEPRAVKLTRIRERVEKMVMEPGLDLFEGLARICREHVNQAKDEDNNLSKADGGIQNPFEATCVHIANRYGTRSSLLLELSESLDASRMWTTDGPPCERPFENRSSLLKDLFRG
jgi:hypothetical protein